MLRGTARISAVLVTQAMLGACAGPTAWEHSFVPQSGATVVKVDAPASTPVRLRRMPFDRLEPLAREFHTRPIAEPPAPDEQSPARPPTPDATLLKMIGAATDHDQVRVLGACNFRTFQTLQPQEEDGQLARFARKIGASDVVWASRYLGKTQTVVEKPISTETSGAYWGRGGDTEQFGANPYNQSTTTWVPVTVERDEHQYLAVFLRRAP